MTPGSRPACADPDYDPDWWTLDHPGRCNKYCPHSLAAHICVNHCPLFQRCQEVAYMQPEVWTGMVIAGQIWNNRANKKRFETPPLRIKCEACPEPVRKREYAPVS